MYNVLKKETNQTEKELLEFEIIETERDLVRKIREILSQEKIKKEEMALLSVLRKSIATLRRKAKPKK